MKLQTFPNKLVHKLALLIGVTALTTSGASAALLAYYVDGTAAEGAALNDLAGNGDVTASNLSAVGFEGGNITRPSFSATSPAGPTAGSSAGSEWLFSRASVVQTTPTITTDYFGFSVDAGSDVLDLNNLVFDVTQVADAGANGGIITTVEVFASTNGGASFTSMSSDVFSLTSGIFDVWSGPFTVNTDLSSISGSSTYEFRIALGDNSSSVSKTTFTQGIQLNGNIAVPEPSSTLLIALGGLALLRRRR